MCNIISSPLWLFTLTNYNTRTVGSMTWPYPWAPKIVPLQIMSIGQLVIVAVPGEFTTMAGRLLKKAVLTVCCYSN